MEEWRKNMERGKLSLRKHDPRGALKLFQLALENCPVQCTRELSRILLYLGSTLMKLGQGDSAIRTWSVCAKVAKEAYAVRMYQRSTNDYGMVKQKSEDEDDWQAFRAIQLCRYMHERRSPSPPTCAEIDMVTDLIQDTYRDLRESGELDGKDCNGKSALFSRVRIVFPLPLTVLRSSAHLGTIIPADFRASGRVDPAKRCTCGSGLPYHLCCGRVSAPREIFSDIP